MRCEVCGHKIHSEPMQAIIEGARLTVCIACSKHGKVVLHEEAALPKKTLVIGGKPVTPGAPIALVQRKKQPIPQVALTKELTDGYANKIRIAREKLLLSHEDLGRKINEKASVLKHIEAGKMAPNNLLATKLEHTLRIQLLVPVAEDKTAVPVRRAASEELTLGDLIEMDKKNEETPTKRKQS